ncbi:MAG: hypothetical protein L0Z55_08495 [Planctomycetes bacterium]|nr:hypothetical protein [Planctomycetota bacterium]
MKKEHPASDFHGARRATPPAHDSATARLAGQRSRSRVRSARCHLLRRENEADLDDLSAEVRARTRFLLGDELGGVLPHALSSGVYHESRPTSRASRLMNLMADKGLIGAFKGSKEREVYCTLEEWEAKQQAG